MTNGKFAVLLHVPKMRLVRGVKIALEFQLARHQLVTQTVLSLCVLFQAAHPLSVQIARYLLSMKKHHCVQER